MSLKRFISIAALCAGLPAAAFAADYDPPIIVDEAPEVVPVEVGSGWYLRGDVAYTVEGAYGDADDVNYAWAVTPADYDEDEIMFSGSVGVGYHFTDWLRSELNVGFIPGNDVNASFGLVTPDGDILASGEIENSAWYGLANVYADLGTFAGLTPYVGGGVGVIRTKSDADTAFLNTIADPDIEESTRFDNREYSVAYSANAGLAYNLGGNVSLDLGYQYLVAPDAEYLRLETVDEVEVEEGLDFHQVKVGLRYDLW